MIAEAYATILVHVYQGNNCMRSLIDIENSRVKSACQFHGLLQARLTKSLWERKF